LEIQKIKELPPLPIIAQQLLAALNSDEASIDEIAKEKPSSKPWLISVPASNASSRSQKKSN